MLQRCCQKILTKPEKKPRGWFRLVQRKYDYTCISLTCKTTKCLIFSFTFLFNFSQSEVLVRTLTFSKKFFVSSAKGFSFSKITIEGKSWTFLKIHYLCHCASKKKTNGKTKKNHKNKLVKRLHGLKNYESGSGCSKDE